VSVGSYRFLTSFLLASDLSSSHENIPAKKSCLKMDLRTNLRYLIRKYIIKRYYLTLSLRLFLSFLVKSFAILPNESALKEKCFVDYKNCTNVLAYWDVLYSRLFDGSPGFKQCDQRWDIFGAKIGTKLSYL